MRPTDAGRSRPVRPALVLVFAMTGLGLNYWAWTLVGPLGLEPDTLFGLRQPHWLLLGALTALAGSLASVPVGMAADRFGAPRVLAAVSISAAVSVLALGAVDSVPALVVVTVLSGVAGTALTAGAVVVGRLCPPSWSGMALSAFSAGMALAAAAAVAVRPVLTVDRHNSLLILAGALLAYACLAVFLTEAGVPVVWGAPSGPRRVIAALRTPAIAHLVRWNAAATCGMAAFDLYLPSYLHTRYGLSPTAAAGYAAGCFGLAAVSRPLGGWWCCRRDPARLLTACYVVIGLSMVVLLFLPRSPLWFGAAVVGVAVSGGLMAGTVFAIVGRSAPEGQFGIIVGLISGVAGTLALVPSLLFAVLPSHRHLFPVAMTLAACAAFAAARRMYARRSWIAAAATYPATTAALETTGTSVVAVSASEMGNRLPEVVRVLALLAAEEELVIAYATGDRQDGYALVTALRSQLPRHNVLAVATAEPPGRNEIDLLADLLQTGAVPVAILRSAQPDPSAISLAHDLAADRAVHLSADRLEALTSAAPRYQPWRALRASTATSASGTRIHSWRTP